MFGKHAGKVSNDGKIYADGFLGETCVGIVESISRVWGDVYIGFVNRAESPHIFGGETACYS